MTVRFTDDLKLVDPGQYVPATVQELLLYLKVDGEPTSRQEAAITDWLKTHPPGRAMQFTLRNHGFGHLP